MSHLYAKRAGPSALRQHYYGPLQSMWADTPWFERSLCFYMIAGTVGTIVYCFTGA